MRQNNENTYTNNNYNEEAGVELGQTQLTLKKKTCAYFFNFQLIGQDIRPFCSFESNIRNSENNKPISKRIKALHGL